MSKDDKDPVAGQEQDLEGLDDTPKGGDTLPSTEPSGGDPLDGIEDVGELKSIAISTATALGKDAIPEIAGVTDPAKLRAVAKKYRAISQRTNKGKGDDPKPAETAPAAPAPAADALTKQDLYRINSRKAVEIAKADPAFKDIDFEAVRPLYVNRRGQETADDIVEDLKDALTVYKSRSAPPTPADPAADLSKDNGNKRQSGKPVPTGERKTQPILGKNQSMKDWYSSKEKTS